jgi:hypothetical protein
MLFPEQEQAVNKITKIAKAGIFIRPGQVGKTVIALTAKQDMQIGLTLIVGTKKIIEKTWQREAAQWEHTQGLDFVKIAGTPKKRKQLVLGNLNADYHLINYELLPWLCDELGHLHEVYDGIILDEGSMLSTPGSKRFRKMRHWAKEIPFRLLLTGTPTGNSIANLWGEMFMVAGEEPLGGSYVKFKKKYGWFVDRDNFIWKPDEDALERIEKRIKPWAFSLPAAHNTGLPMVKVQDIELELPRRAREIYDEIWDTGDVEIGKHVIEAPEDIQRISKCRQVAAGGIYINRQHDYEHLHDEKYEALLDLLEELEGSPLMVVYEFEFEKTALRDMGFVELEEEAWCAGEQPRAMLHPKSGGHGLNLQTGGSNIFFLTIPQALDQYEQVIARLARRGQPEDVVMVYRPVMQNTTDTITISSLLHHGDVQTALIQAVRLPHTGLRRTG